MTVVLRGPLPAPWLQGPQPSLWAGFVQLQLERRDTCFKKQGVSHPAVGTEAQAGTHEHVHTHSHAYTLWFSMAVLVQPSAASSSRYCFSLKRPYPCLSPSPLSSLNRHLSGTNIWPPGISWEVSGHLLPRAAALLTS